MSKSPEKILGEVYSFTTITDPDRVPTRFREFFPYTVAIVLIINGDLMGKKVTAMMTDLDYKDFVRTLRIDSIWGDWGEETQCGRNPLINIGMTVEMTMRVLHRDGETGLITHGYKFRPLIESQKR